MIRRPLAGAVATTACAVLALACAACGSASGADGATACGYISKSLVLYAQSLGATGSQQTRLADEALAQLRDAQQPAGLAAAGDPEWQALSATVNEAATIPERNLTQALRAECADAPTASKSTTPR